MRAFSFSALLIVAFAAPAVAALSPLDNLRDMGVAVALPADVPGGFRLEKVLTPRAWGGPAFGASYVALYRGPGDQGFAIESAGTDTGSITNWDEHPVAKVQPRYFPHSREVGLYWQGPRANLPRGWVSEWIEGPQQYYRLIGPGHVRNDYGAVWTASRELDRAVAVRVLDSIRILGSGPVGKRPPSSAPRPFLTDFQQDDQWRELRTVPIQ